MSNIKLGNGPCIQSYAMSMKYIQTPCDCIGADVGLILSTMFLGGSNLHNHYPGERCPHNNPIKASTVAYILNNYKEEAIKVKGKTDIQGWLDHIMRGSVALVFFRTLGAHHTGTLDLYLTNKLWINSGVANEVDEMWVWVIGGKSPKVAHKSRSKSHHKAVVMF